MHVEIKTHEYNVTKLKTNTFTGCHACLQQYKYTFLSNYIHPAYDYIYKQIRLREQAYRFKFTKIHIVRQIH